MIKPAKDTDFAVDFDADDDFITAPALNLAAWDRETLTATTPGIDLDDPFLSASLDAPMDLVGAVDPFADLQPIRSAGAPSALERQILEEQAFTPPAGEPMGSGLPSFNAGIPDAGEASVPRIAIHIFCDRPETASAAEAA